MREQKSNQKESSGLATAGMVLGIIAIVGSWIPFLNIVSILLGVLALIFCAIPLFQKRSTGKAVTGVVLGLLSVIIGVYMTSAATDSIDKAINADSTSSNESSKEATEVNAEPTRIDVKELGDAFNANQPAAERDWGGKLVEFSAEITNINDGSISFSKGVDSEEYSITQISCRLQDSEQAMGVQNGQTVTVQGVVGDQTIGVIGLKDCKIL